MTEYYTKCFWPGRHELTEADTEMLWAQLVEEAIAPIVFYDQEMTIDDFNEVVFHRGNLFAAVYDSASIPQAVFWLNNPLGKTWMIHFGFFRDAMKQSKEIGRKVCGWCFAGGNVSALYGLTPMKYFAAIDYIQEIGFQVLGTLPESCYMFRLKRHVDGAISMLTKEDLENGG